MSQILSCQRFHFEPAPYDYPTQFAGQLGAADEPLSLKERVSKARYYAEEERTMKRLDSLLWYLLFCLPYAFVHGFPVNLSWSYFGSTRLRLAETQYTKLVPGLYEVFYAIENGTFTSHERHILFGLRSAFGHLMSLTKCDRRVPVRVPAQHSCGYLLEAISVQLSKKKKL
ncbi:hypothetical protein K503DRAFT_783286 [Rhizopogon vinicolor AM-OR11-026]|uniref:Uncharacterized protein n=1 Tax=Rhizopogon vinicolor AM-OR11-026 TaxID=1314800 RepID=A0A1B7MZ56_9AGAM|nr:hypothetical protein K503DRAFT_783286 [Rhizopogon vinicolor AM-OR11-026]